MTKLPAIVIGSGWGAHSARALAKDPRVELRAIVGRGSERTTTLAAELGVSVHPSVEEAVAAEAPAFAVLAIGERAHRDVATSLLRAGAHVLCAHPVAPMSEDVLAIAEVARREGRVARTDYSFRIRPELRALLPCEARGQSMRLAIEAPGRWLPIALDAAVAIAGPAASVFASSTYPEAIRARVERLPQAFPPAILIEHASGVVTSLVAFPHAWPAAPVRAAASFERGRAEAWLPCGGARWLACGRAGAVEERELVTASADLRDAAVHGRAMSALASAFVDCLLAGADALATLEEEAHLRGVWSAVWSSARRGARVDVPLA